MPSQDSPHPQPSLPVARAGNRRTATSTEVGGVFINFLDLVSIYNINSYVAIDCRYDVIAVKEFFERFTDRRNPTLFDKLVDGKHIGNK